MERKKTEPEAKETKQYKKKQAPRKRKTKVTSTTGRLDE